MPAFKQTQVLILGLTQLAKWPCEWSLSCLDPMRLMDPWPWGSWTSLMLSGFLTSLSFHRSLKTQAFRDHHQQQGHFPPQSQMVRCNLHVWTQLLLCPCSHKRPQARARGLLRACKWQRIDFTSLNSTSGYFRTQASIPSVPIHSPKSLLKV